MPALTINPVVVLTINLRINAVVVHHNARRLPDADMARTRDGR